MTRYRITADGYEVGQYEAEHFVDALDQCARDHGHESYLDALIKSVRGDPVRMWEVSEWETDDA
jgi:hypothetical protein